MGTEKRKKTVRHTKKNEASTLQSKDAELVIESHEEGSFILWHSLVCLVLFVAVYVKCTSVSIPSGDAGDFVMTAYHFGVAHPPGYPLYVTIGYIWMRILPFGTPAFKLNLLTSIIGGVAAFILYITTFRLTKFVPSAILASSVFAFSHLTWFHSIGAEIFALNNLFCGLLLYWVVKFQRAAVTSRAKIAVEASFISGLSMCNQHTSILFIAVIGMWMFVSLLRDKSLTGRQFVLTGVAFLFGLLPYIQLPLSAYFSNSPITWGNHKTLTAILNHITRGDYGSMRLSANDHPSNFLVSFKLLTMDMIHELGMLTAVLCVFCLVTARNFPSIKTEVNVYVSALSLYTLFFCKQANIDTSRPFLSGVLERFWMQSNIVVSVLSGCGLWTLYSTILTKYPRLKNGLYAIFSIGALLVAWRQVSRNYSSCDMSENKIVETYGKAILDGLPPNSIVLLSGDVESYSTRYLRYCEGYRDDVDVIDSEMLGYPWFKETHQHGLKHFIFPEERTRYLWFSSKDNPIWMDEQWTYSIEDIFDVHSQAGIPLYVYNIKNMKEEAKDFGWQDHYEFLQNDLVKEVRRKDKPCAIEQMLEKVESRKFTFRPEDCDPTLYPERSWERFIAKDLCSKVLLNPPVSVLEKIPDVHGEGHKLLENRVALLRIFNLLKKSHHALTIVDTHGQDKMLFGPTSNYNLGIISWMIFNNFKNTGDTLEAAKYARVMTEQWGIFVDTSDNLQRRKLVSTTIKDVANEIPDLMTNEKYLFM